MPLITLGFAGLTLALTRSEGNTEFEGENTWITKGLAPGFSSTSPSCPMLDALVAQAEMV